MLQLSTEQTGKLFKRLFSTRAASKRRHFDKKWSASTTVPDASTASLRSAVSANRSSSSSSGIQSSASDSPCQCNSSISCSPPLPNFQSVSNPVFGWGSLDAESFSHALEEAYSEAVHWRSNSFKVPLGRFGKEFVNELSRLFSAFASSSSMESVVLRATIVLPILLLQKPHRRSRAKDHTACLERGLQCILAYPNPFGSLAQNFVQISEMLG